MSNSIFGQIVDKTMKFIKKPVTPIYHDIPQKMPYDEDELIINLILPETSVTMIAKMQPKYIPVFVRNVEYQYNRIYPILSNDKIGSIGYKVHIDKEWGILSYLLQDINDRAAVTALLSSLASQMNTGTYNVQQQIMVKTEHTNRYRQPIDGRALRASDYQPLTIHFTDNSHIVESYTFDFTKANIFRIHAFQILAMLSIDDGMAEKCNTTSLLVDAHFEAMLLDFANLAGIEHDVASPEKIDDVINSPVTKSENENGFYYRELSCNRLVGFAKPSYEIGRIRKYIVPVDMDTMSTLTLVKLEEK